MSQQPITPDPELTAPASPLFSIPSWAPHVSTKYGTIHQSPFGCARRGCTFATLTPDTRRMNLAVLRLFLVQGVTLDGLCISCAQGPDQPHTPFCSRSDLVERIQTRLDRLGDRLEAGEEIRHRVAVHAEALRHLNYILPATSQLTIAYVSDHDVRKITVPEGTSPAEAFLATVRGDHDLDVSAGGMVRGRTTYPHAGQIVGALLVLPDDVAASLL